MENEKLLPTGWHWKITPEQIEKIKERDRDTVNKVYFDNYDKFQKMAICYCKAIRRRDFIDDCLQQIYVDILDYDFTSCLTLWRSIRCSFWRACGTTRKFDFISLDTPLFNDGDNEQTLMDYIADNIGADYDEQQREKQEQERHVLDVIAAQTQLTERKKDILTAIALGCLAYQGIFSYEYRQAYSL